MEINTGDKKKMRKIIMVVMLFAVLMAGCSKTCKIEGCKNEVYKEGLCQKHYYVNQGADAVEDAVKGIMDIIK